MTPGNGVKPKDTAEKTLGEIVSEVSEKASLLVREEIELAKAEITQKVSKLGTGAAIGAAAGAFLFFAFVIFLFALSFFWNDLFDWETVWFGFAVTTVLLIVLGIVAGFLAYRFIKRSRTLAPEMAIEEAKLTREALEHQTIERDQMERSLESAGKEAQS
jgi:hypothetical protein